jgi:hypothetical protein
MFENQLDTITNIPINTVKNIESQSFIDESGSLFLKEFVIYNFPDDLSISLVNNDFPEEKNFTDIVEVNGSEVKTGYSNQSIDNEIVLSLDIFGEQFIIEEEDGCFYITHPKWSLVGYGETLIDAENDLISDAIDLNSHIMTIPYGSFDEDGKNLYDFLIKVDSQCRSLVEK